MRRGVRCAVFASSPGIPRTAHPGASQARPLEVQAHGEVRALGGQHDDAHIVLFAQLAHQHREIRPEGRTHGVALRRPVEPQRGHVSLSLDREHLGGRRHARMLRAAGDRAPPARRDGGRNLALDLEDIVPPPAQVG